MKHIIEISTADALLIIQLMLENNLENEIDKLCVERLKEKIIKTVSEDLSQKINKDFKGEKSYED